MTTETQTMSPESPFNSDNWQNMPWTLEQVESIAIRLNTFHALIVSGAADAALENGEVLETQANWEKAPDVVKAALASVAILVLTGAIAEEARAIFLQQNSEHGNEAEQESKRLTRQFLLMLKATEMEPAFDVAIDNAAGRFADEATQRAFTAYTNGYLYGRNYQFGSDREFTERLVELVRQRESSPTS